MKTVNGMMNAMYFKAMALGQRKRRGDFTADKGIVIAITVALGGLALFIAFPLLKDVIGVELTNAIKGFFNFK